MYTCPSVANAIPLQPETDGQILLMDLRGDSCSGGIVFFHAFPSQ